MQTIKEQLCDWMIANIGTDLDPLRALEHITTCPICAPTMDRKAAEIRTENESKIDQVARLTFGEGVADLGGPLDESHLPGQGEAIIANINRVNRTIIDGINETPTTDPCGDLYIGHVSNASLNAVAFEHGGREFVGLYAGLTFAIDNLCFCLFACPEFLKRTFPTKSEKLNLDDVKDIVRAVYDPTHKPRITNWEPANWVRAHASAYVTRLAQALVSFHEVGHVVGGHLIHPICSSNRGARLFEHSENRDLDENEKILRQALEFDADAYSSGLISQLALKNEWIFWPGKRHTIEEIATHFCLALNLLYYCLDLFSVSGRLKSSLDHPVPGVRLAHAFSVIRGCLAKGEPQLLAPASSTPKPIDVISVIFLKCYADILDFWHALELPCRTVEHDIASLFDAGNEVKVMQRKVRDQVLKDLCTKRRSALSYSASR